MQWLVGAYYESRSFNTESDGFNFGADAPLFFGSFGIPGSTNLRFADIDEELFAVFGQTTYQFTDALALTAGLRYETITRSKLSSVLVIVS
ncbi:MAG: TonB-dependent receptor, partial [Merismopedia sp. SIO2A8]|nr:TonB-dependent receptor [Merismopedia sp. SIO2A8]